MIVIVAAEKGGVGKTSVSVNLAALAVADGIDTLLLDTDSTGSATAWCRIRAEEGIEPAVQTLTLAANPARAIAEIAPRYDLIVVDIGARSYNTMLQLALLADLMIVPTTPGQFEAESTLNLFEALRGIDGRHKQGRIPAHALLNQLPTNPRSREEADLRAFLAEEKLPVMQSALRDRKAWRDASRTGRAVTELRRPDFNAAAAVEMRAVYEEAARLAGDDKASAPPSAASLAAVESTPATKPTSEAAARHPSARTRRARS